MSTTPPIPPGGLLPPPDPAEAPGRLRAALRQSGLSQAAAARRLGIDPGNLSKYLSGKLPLTRAMVERVAAVTGDDPLWLLRGELQSEPAVATPAAGAAAVRPAGAPVYDIDVTAGPHEHSMELTQEHLVGYVNLPGINPEAPLVHVSGDSMHPVIQNGALIAIRPVTVCRDIFWGQIYVVVLDDYRMVKYVHRNAADPERVVLRSANERYDDMDIALSSIRRLFLVEDILNINRRY